MPCRYGHCHVADDWELARKQIKLVKQLVIGEFGPIYEAEVKLKTNVSVRALVKVSTVCTYATTVDQCYCESSSQG